MAGQTLKETVADIPVHACDKDLIAAALRHGIEHLDNRQKSLVLMARLLCVFLPENSEIATGLRARAVALLKSRDGQTEADALYLLAKSAVRSADRYISNAMRINGDPQRKADLESIRILINWPSFSTDPVTWRTAISNAERILGG